MQNNNQQFTYLKNFTPAPYAIKHVDLKIEIEEQQTKVISTLTIEPLANTKSGTELVLDGNDLMPNFIAINDKALSITDFTLMPNSIIIHSPPFKKFNLKTEVIIKPQDNTDLMGLYRSNSIWCTQCEAEGFRNITYFLDRPDILATYKVHLSADKEFAPILLSNGNLLESGDLENNRHYAIWHDPHPKPSYLFALVAGDLGSITDEFTTMSGKKVDLAIYCEHGKEDRCTYAMDALKRSMIWEEKRFGLEYDLSVFNIVAVSDFNFGAMENKGLNIFNDRLILAKPQSATDADYARIESVVAHEYFHNWSGNRVTCQNWFQLCLKEGLTVYRDQEFTSDERSRPVKRIEDVRLLRMAQFPEDNGPLAHPARPEKYSEIDNFYTATVYEKGAEIVRMLATLLGEKEFSKGCSLYFNHHDGEATTIEAWIKIFEDSSNQDLSHFMQWYLQAGTPEVEVNETWDEQQKTFTLSLKQTTKPTPDQSKKQPMLIPIKFALLGANGNDMEFTCNTKNVKNDIIILDSEKLEITFEGFSYKPVLSFLREFSAPIKVTSNATMSDKIFLAAHDSDPFNRWQAINDNALEILVEAVKNGGNFKQPNKVKSLIEILKQTLADNNLDDALKSLALSMPSEKNIALAFEKNINPKTIYETRKTLLKQIGTTLYKQLETSYHNLTKICSPYSQTAVTTHARSLRNQCLSLIVASGNNSALNNAKTHYFDADNMSDRMAAIAAIIAHSNKDAPILLADFKQKYCDDILVYDKWLALNASTPNENTLERVKEIYNHSDFPKKNPNRVRSLIGVFCNHNSAQFTNESGAAFTFIVKVIKELDKINPSLAAQILTSFGSWKTYEPIRKEKAKSALESLKKNNLSRNCLDILTRIIA